MPTSHHCPVCKLAVEKTLPEFCAHCGWELQNDISLVLSIDLPDDVIRTYERKLVPARQVWESRRAEAEEREALKAALEKAEREKRAALERAALAAVREAAKATPKGGDSEKTPVPELARDVFETPEEFRERITKCPPPRPRDPRRYPAYTPYPPGGRTA